MQHHEVVRELKGRVRALLTEVEIAGKRLRPLELYGNSRIVKELWKYLILLERPQEYRDAFGDREPTETCTPPDVDLTS